MTSRKSKSSSGRSKVARLRDSSSGVKEARDIERRDSASYCLARVFDAASGCGDSIVGKELVKESCGLSSNSAMLIGSSLSPGVVRSGLILGLHHIGHMFAKTLDSSCAMEVCATTRMSSVLFHYPSAL